MTNKSIDETSNIEPKDLEYLESIKLPKPVKGKIEFQSTPSKSIDTRLDDLWKRTKRQGKYADKAFTLTDFKQALATLIENEIRKELQTIATFHDGEAASNEVVAQHVYDRLATLNNRKGDTK